MYSDQTRRRFLRTCGAVALLGGAGCSGSPSESSGDDGDSGRRAGVVVRGATTYDREWTVALSPDLAYELELTQSDGIYAVVGVSRLRDATTVVQLDTEREETVRTDFTVPSQDDYLIILQANGAESPRGRSSFVLRAR